LREEGVHLGFGQKAQEKRVAPECCTFDHFSHRGSWCAGMFAAAGDT
jgi:hypothetical protein